MIYIAKMGSRYPELHGADYYNFIMAETREELTGKLEDNKHDFYLINERKTRFGSVEAVLKKYPTAEDLNKALFSK